MRDFLFNVGKFASETIDEWAVRRSAPLSPSLVCLPGTHIVPAEYSVLFDKSLLLISWF